MPGRLGIDRRDRLGVLDVLAFLPAITVGTDCAADERAAGCADGGAEEWMSAAGERADAAADEAPVPAPCCVLFIPVQPAGANRTNANSQIFLFMVRLQFSPTRRSTWALPYARNRLLRQVKMIGSPNATALYNARIGFVGFTYRQRGDKE